MILMVSFETDIVEISVELMRFTILSVSRNWASIATGTIQIESLQQASYIMYHSGLF